MKPTVFDYTYLFLMFANLGFGVVSALAGRELDILSIGIFAIMLYLKLKNYKTANK